MARLELVSKNDYNVKLGDLKNYYNNKEFRNVLPTILGSTGNAVMDPYTTGVSRPSGKLYFNAKDSLGGLLMLSLPASASIGRIYLQLSSGIGFTYIVKEIPKGAPSVLIIPVPFLTKVGNVLIPSAHEATTEDTVVHSFFITGWNSGYGATFYDKTSDIISGEYDIIEDWRSSWLGEEE